MKKCLPNYFGNHFAVEGAGQAGCEQNLNLVDSVKKPFCSKVAYEPESSKVGQKLLCPKSPRAKFLRNFCENATKFWRKFS